MSSWWKKVIAVVSGDQIDRPEEEALAHPPSDQNPTGLDDIPDAVTATEVGDVYQELPARLADLTDRVEKQFTQASERTDRILADLERLSAAVDGLVATGNAQGGDLAQLLDSTRSTHEHSLRMREIVDGLPDIGSAQAASLGGLEHRVEGINARTAAIADALDAHARSIAELKASHADVGRAVSNSTQVQTDLGARQRQIAESVDGLYKRLTEVTELFKSHMARLKQVAEAPQRLYDGLREHISNEVSQIAATCDKIAAQSQTTATRTTITLALAALAALAAAAGILLR